MTFEELQACWKGELPDDQHRSPAALKQHAITTTRRAELRATIFEFWALAVFGLLGVATLFDAIGRGAPWGTFVPPLVMLGITAFIYTGRKRRLQSADFTGSLADIVQRRLSKAEEHIGRVKSFLWWFVVPVMLAVGIDFAFSFADRPLWQWAILPTGVASVWLAMLMATQASHEPLRATLKSLSEQLSRDDSLAEGISDQEK